ncbi:MAG: hypothetical protein ACRDI2_20030, partial [Chloroflexota bacterium]
FRALRGVARAEPVLAPWITPLLVAYGLFAFLTWTADPFFNLLLRLNRFGRYALSGEQVMASNWVGACVLVALGAGVTFAATQNPAFLIAALLAGLLVLLVAGTFRCAPGLPRRAMAAYTALVALAGLASVAVFLALPSEGPDPLDAPGIGLLGLTLLGAVLGTWIANFLSAIRPKR